MAFIRNPSVASAVRVAMAIAALAVALYAAQPASAETTHRFIKEVELPVTSFQLLGVDPQGNLIVWTDREVRKYSPNGEPVNFSGLGTNVLDGAGGLNCPTTPSDCDRIDWNGFGPELPGYVGWVVLAAMNQAKTGPTAGYIYVAAVRETQSGDFLSQIDVFDASGKYKGKIDTTQATPYQSPEGLPSFLSVSPDGILLVTYNLNLTNVTDPFHADKYQAINANPADDTFVGQIRKEAFGGMAGGGFALGAIADDDVVYVGRGIGAFGPGYFRPAWELYDANSFGVPQGDTPPVNLDPNECECDSAGPWGAGGFSKENSALFESASIDPSDHHVYLLDSHGGAIEEWATPSEQIGPSFGNAENLAGASGQMAFDTSGISSTDGRIYVSKGHSVVVFGPPAPIPDFRDLSAVVGHNDAEISATVDLDHGPKVTDCKVEWGEEIPGSPVFYSQFEPCNPPAPYTDESTPISVHIGSLQTETDYRARVVVKTNNGVNRSQGIKVRPPAVLSVATQPPTEVTPTTAVLHGSLDADGVATTYSFEYGIDTAYRQETAVASAGEATEETSVDPVEIGGLQPGRRYHYRLVAANSFGTSRGPDQTFVAASPPAISGVRPSNVEETSATLSALVNPGGYPTEYRFEYGPSPDYGQSLPVDGESVGDGNDPVPVSVKPTGLSSGVEYHFRIVATNVWGTEESDDSTFTFFPNNCPNAYVRQLTRSAYLPDCRAYELVSPGDAGGIQLYPGDLTQDYFFYSVSQLPYLRTYAQNLGGATSPARFTFHGVSGALPGTNPPNSLIDSYTSTRTAAGWISRYWGQQGNASSGAGGAECNERMDICIDYDLPSFLGPDPNDKGSNAPYVWDSQGKSLGRWPTNLGLVKNGEDFYGEDRPSPDFSHYVFSSNNVRFTPDGVTSAPGSVYDNDVEVATVTKASVLPNGQDIPAGEGESGQHEEVVKLPAVSTDGSHILMTTQGFGGASAVNLYMRVDDAITYQIAKGKQFVRLIGMTADGSKVVFASRDHVTADDTDNALSDDIYVWEEQSDEVTRVSTGNGAGNSDACQPTQGFRCSTSTLETERPDSDDAIASQSGDVYFYSPEQLDGKNPGVFNEKNLYVYRNGAVKYVATLDKGTQIDRIQISPDGEHVAFLTAARLTSYDNEGWREIYTFDPETGVIRCASCIPDGEPPRILRAAEEPGAQGDRGLASKDVMASQSGRFMADDGRIAFATSDALVEGDTNGLVDVYEFVGGRPQLITSGTGRTDFQVGNSFFLPGEYTGLEAVSHDGVDIYFSTYDTLAPREDFNGEFLKFYDARTSGGFPPPAPRLPCVAADECHGPENPGPKDLIMGTTADLGSTDKVSDGAGKRKKHRAKKRQVHRKRNRKNGKGRQNG